MECDAYYETHPPYEGTGDRCSVNEIAAGTALQYSILGMSTTFCGELRAKKCPSYGRDADAQASIEAPGTCLSPAGRSRSGVQRLP